MSHDPPSRAAPESEELDPRSQDIAAGRLRELLRLFPEIRTEGDKVDFGRLKLALGNAVDAGRERFGLTWPGKTDCFRTIQAPSLGTLRPSRQQSVDFDATHNILIEGDNLEVLKLLQKPYAGKVKMIYIDPPYNTGNDFVYPDHFGESLQVYLAYTGQVDAQGRKFATNSEADGRFHSKWLSMMYPRLYLARGLMREDAFIFISIDDREAANLRMVCNEVFGEENFIANVVWQKKYTRSNDARFFSDNHDHILVYARNRDTASLNLLQRSDDQASAYANPDNHPKGPWKATPLHAKSGKAEGFRYVFKNGFAWRPPRGTYPRFSSGTLARLDEGGEIWFGADGKATPSRKTFLSEAKAGVTPTTIWPSEEVGHNHEANNELKSLGLARLFDNPKPTRLIGRMLELTTNDTDQHIVLDFFAGSGTTAQAVLEANASDGGNRRFILVQLPEPTEVAEYPTIASIARERIRRAAAKLDAAKACALKVPDEVPDRGFRSFHLDTSNFTAWDGTIPHNEARLVRQLESQIDPVRAGRSSLDILFEILVKSGYPLSAGVDAIGVANVDVYSIDQGRLLVCLNPGLTQEAIHGLAAGKPECVVCLDRAFAGNDRLKAGAVGLFRSEGITFRTI
jgi:adenine-specific DNA-methyltransferase